MSLSALNPWTQHATREARQLVLSILRSRGEPVAAHDLYNLLVAQEAQTIATSPSSGSQHAAPTLTTGNTNTPVPPHPSHVIRSMKYAAAVSLVHSVLIRAPQVLEAPGPSRSHAHEGRPTCLLGQ